MWGNHQFPEPRQRPCLTAMSLLLVSFFSLNALAQADYEEAAAARDPGGKMQIVAELQPPLVGPYSLDMDPAGQFIYIGHYNNTDQVTKINVSSFRAVGHLNCGAMSV